MFIAPILFHAGSATVVSPARTVVAGTVAAPTSAGTVVVQLENASSADDEYLPFETAVRNALANAAFLVLPDFGRSRYLARVSVSRRPLGVVASDGKEAKSTHSVGDWGAGVQFTLPSHKREVHDLIVTTLTVSISVRSSRKTVWEGSALTAQSDGTPAGDPARVGAKLATAILERFPGPVGPTISVP